MLKRGISIFFLALFLVNSVVFSMLTLIRIKIHQSSEFWKTENVNPIDLRISVSEMNSPSSTFHWLEENEFSYNGYRYDVIFKIQEKDFLVLKCINDSKEESLFQKLKEHTAQNENNLPAKSKTVVIKKGLDFDRAAFSLSFSKLISSSIFSEAMEPFVQSVFQSPPSPPPWLV